MGTPPGCGTSKQLILFPSYPQQRKELLLSFEAEKLHKGIQVVSELCQGQGHWSPGERFKQHSPCP